MKKISRPLLDSRGIDFGTGKPNPEAMKEEEKSRQKSRAELQEKARVRASDPENEKKLIRELYF